MFIYNFIIIYTVSSNIFMKGKDFHFDNTWILIIFQIFYGSIYIFNSANSTIICVNEVSQIHFHETVFRSRNSTISNP